MNLSQLLLTLDKKSNNSIEEEDIHSALTAIRQESRNSKTTKFRLDAELLAFSFIEEPKKIDKNDSYYIPKYIWTDENGISFSSSSPKQITNEILIYWQKRASKTLNPILKYRYCGLIIEFSKPINGQNAPLHIRNMFIRASIEISENSITKNTYKVISNLRRALLLSLDFSDDVSLKAIKLTLISFIESNPNLIDENIILEIHDILILNKKSGINPSEEQYIIEELEKTFRKIISTENYPYNYVSRSIESIADRLAEFYKNKNKQNEVIRVLRLLDETYSKLVNGVSPLIAINLLERLHLLYIKYKYNDEAKSILIKIRELGPKVATEMKQVSFSYEIPKLELDNYIESITLGVPEEILKRISIAYLPDKFKTAQQLRESTNNSSINHLIPQKILDNKGRIIATIGPLTVDPEGHLISQISQQLKLQSVILNMVLKEAISNKGLTCKEISKFLSQSFIFEKDRIPIIDKALNCYFNNDYTSFIHLLIPQIEQAIRFVYEFAGGDVLRRTNSSGGGYYLKTFDELLREGLTKEVLGENLVIYLRVIYTDSRGWNIRNNIFHGLVGQSIFNNQTADRLLHSLLCLGLIKND